MMTDGPPPSLTPRPSSLITIIPEYDRALEEISDAVMDPLLPLHEFQEALAPIGGRIDAGLTQQLQVRSRRSAFCIACVRR